MNYMQYAPAPTPQAKPKRTPFYIIAAVFMFVFAFVKLISLVNELSYISYILNNLEIKSLITEALYILSVLSYVALSIISGIVLLIGDFGKGAKITFAIFAGYISLYILYLTAFYSSYLEIRDFVLYQLIRGICFCIMASLTVMLFISGKEKLKKTKDILGFITIGLVFVHFLLVVFDYLTGGYNIRYLIMDILAEILFLGAFGVFSLYLIFPYYKNTPSIAPQAYAYQMPNVQMNVQAPMMQQQSYSQNYAQPQVPMYTQPAPQQFYAQQPQTPVYPQQYSNENKE